MDGIFRHRAHAGQVLAPKLRRYAHRGDVLVLAVSRGGVAVAVELAEKLHVPADILLVRKLMVPDQVELAMGAIASGGVEFLDRGIITALGIQRAAILTVGRRERAEVRRQELALRRGRRPRSIAGRTVILADDGIVTGSTMRAAVKAVHAQRGREVVIAAPVASSESLKTLQRAGVEVVTVVTDERLFAIGAYYRDFHPLSDAEIRRCLTRVHSTVVSKSAAA